MNDRELVRYTSLAASSYNTQPWKFKIDDGSISILPDFTRRCPVVDPDDHHLFASLGCAAENLLVAAEGDGLHGQSAFDKSRDGGAVRIALEKAPPRWSRDHRTLLIREEVAGTSETRTVEKSTSWSSSAELHGSLSNASGAMQRSIAGSDT